MLDGKNVADEFLKTAFSSCKIYRVKNCTSRHIDDTDDAAGLQRNSLSHYMRISSLIKSGVAEKALLFNEQENG